MPSRFLRLAVVFVCVVCFGVRSSARQDQFEKARARIDDLRFEVYATSRQVEELATDEAARPRAWSVIRQMGITKVYVEVYRGGHVVPGSQLTFVRDWLQDKGHRRGRRHRHRTGRQTSVCASRDLSSGSIGRTQRPNKI